MENVRAVQELENGARRYMPLEIYLKNESLHTGPHAQASVHAQVSASNSSNQGSIPYIRVQQPKPPQQSPVGENRLVQGRLIRTTALNQKRPTVNLNTNGQSHQIKLEQDGQFLHEKPRIEERRNTPLLNLLDTDHLNVGSGINITRKFLH